MHGSEDRVQTAARRVADALERYARHQRREDLVVALQAASPLLGTDSGGPVESLVEALVGLSRGRYIQSQDPTDLSLALEAIRLAVESSTDPARTSAYQHELALGLQSRFQAAEDNNAIDLDEAIDLSRRSLAPDFVPAMQRAARLGTLGFSLQLRFTKHHRPADLEAAVGALRACLALLPLEAPERDGALMMLSEAELDWCNITGTFEGVIAVERLMNTPSASPHRGRDRAYTEKHIRLLRVIYEATVDEDARHRIIALVEEMVRNVEQSDTERAKVFLLAARQYRWSYLMRGEPNHLDAGLALAETLCASPRDEPDVDAEALAILGSLLRLRYGRDSNVGDLERAVAVSERAVQESRTPLDEAGALNNLGLALSERYRRANDRRDLSLAIEHWAAAVEKSLEAPMDRAKYQTNLGGGLFQRYGADQRLERWNPVDDTDDIDKAIHVLSEATDVLPERSFDRGPPLQLLANSFLARWYIRDDDEDLERGLEAGKEALIILPPTHPARESVLHTVALLLLTSWGKRRDLSIEDIKYAIGIEEEAISLLHERSPDLPARFHLLGCGHLALAEKRGDVRELIKSVELLEHAWRGREATFANNPVAYRLARSEAVETGFALVTARIWQSRSTQFETTASRRALEVIEGCKSRVLTELIAQRDLPLPPGASREVGRDERELLDALAVLDSTELAAVRAEEFKSVDRGAEYDSRQHLVERLQQVWDSIEQLGRPGQEYVALRRGIPARWDELIAMATRQNSPSQFVSLFITNDQTFACVFRADSLAPLILDCDLGLAEWGGALRRLAREIHTSRGTDRGMTWLEAIRPLVDILAPQIELDQSIIISAFAAAHIFPWRVVLEGIDAPKAAGLRVVSVPSLSVLARGEPYQARVDGEPLVIGNPTGDLREAEDEATAVAEEVRVQPLLRGEAKKAAVLERLEAAQIVHIASHAHYDAADPLGSGLVLADGVLTGRELLGTRLTCDLIVLSGCETGLVGVLGGDEMAGLSQILLSAGARSCLISLWRVEDQATRIFMTAFYRAMKTKDKAQAVADASAAVRVTPGRSHPYFWGGFQLLGRSA